MFDDKKNIGQTAPATLGQSVAFTKIAVAYAKTASSTNAQAHGGLAEKANHILDILLGKHAIHCGPNNAKFGADRIIDGLEIQTKYCASPKACIDSIINSADGEIIYWHGGDVTRPMLIEVPSDFYDDAIIYINKLIQRAKVAAFVDPDDITSLALMNAQDASRLIVKGRLTYQQAVNLTRSGTIDGLIFDATSGAVLVKWPMGISASVTFAQSIWNGAELKDALRDAASCAALVGGRTLATHIMTQQLARTSFDASLRPATDWAIHQLGPKLASTVAKANGRTLYGASAKSYAAKLVRGNVASTIVLSAVLSTADLYRLSSGSISGSQAFKNITSIVASVGLGAAGAGAGMTYGATAGAAIGSVVPIVGTAVGGAIGGFLGAMFGGAAAGSAAGGATRWVLDHMIEDDAKEMAIILENAVACEAHDHILNEVEVQNMIEQITSTNLPNTLRDIYKSSDRPSFARGYCRPIAFKILSERPKIDLPSNT